MTTPSIVHGQCLHDLTNTCSGWWLPYPLKNMKVSWDDSSQYMEIQLLEESTWIQHYQQNGGIQQGKGGNLLRVFS